MSTAQSRPSTRRTGLDRLAPTADPVPAEDPTSDVVAAGVDDRWGMSPPPAWLEDDGAEGGPDTRMSVGGHFGAGDVDDDLSPRRRFVMAPPAAVALIIVGVVACVVAGVALLRNGSGTSTPVAFPSTAGPAAAATGPSPAGAVPSATPTVPSQLVVSVVGLVRRPGLVHLPGAARVADAIDRAGGARSGADLLSLNLAQRLHDGDQVLVGYSGGGKMSLRSAVIGPPGGPSVPGSGVPAAPNGSSAAGGGATAGAKVNLNTATEAQLDALPGVGPVTAKSILAWRDQHGRFASVEQLGEVDGIGPVRLAKLRNLVTV